MSIAKLFIPGFRYVWLGMNILSAAMGENICPSEE
jgi:hypothetical protein